MNDARFKEFAKLMGVELGETQLNQFNRYEYHLKKWSTRVRLVSKKDITFLRERHFLDSLLLVRHLCKKPCTLLDIGSGGGFPGIPVKIVRPDIEVSLVESTRMKSLFLKDIIDTLGLSGLNLIQDRAENLPNNQQGRHGFHIVTARAVGPLPDLWKLAEPMLNERGRLLAFKGPGSLKEFGEEIPDNLSVTEYESWDVIQKKERVIVIVQKDIKGNVP